MTDDMSTIEMWFIYSDATFTTQLYTGSRKTPYVKTKPGSRN